MREPQYYIDHKLKPPKAFFEWCDSQIHTFKWSNKKKTILASDRKNCFVVEKRLTKRTNLDFFDKFYSFAIILVTAKRIEIQSYGYWSEIINGKQEIESRMVNFERYSEDEIIKLGRFKDQWYEGLVANYHGMGGAYQGTKFYSNSWRDKIEKVSELKYLRIAELPYWHIAHLYKYRQEIEFLQKINSKLAEDIYYQHNVDMRTINQRWLRENKKYLKNSDRDFQLFELEQRIKKRNGKLVPGIEKYLRYHDIKKIPKGIGMIKFQNWIIKNKVRFDYYLDYLDMLKDLSIDCTGDDNLICPKDLTKAHDNAVKLLNQLERERKRAENEQKQKEYEKTLAKRQRLEATFDGYAFILPKSLNDLIVEGKKLHHCVGGSGYIDKHEKGETTIIFVRDINNIEKPFYTLEYREKSIKQLRGKHNRSATDEVQVAADQWLAWVKAGCKQKTRVAA